MCEWVAHLMLLPVCCHATIFASAAYFASGSTERRCCRTANPAATAFETQWSGQADTT